MCGGCAKRVCSHASDDPPGIIACATCGIDFCAACDEKKQEAECEAGLSGLSIF